MKKELRGSIGRVLHRRSHEGSGLSATGSSVLRDDEDDSDTR
jgi:hypothetical protein